VGEEPNISVSPSSLEGLLEELEDDKLVKIQEELEDE